MKTIEAVKSQEKVFDNVIEQFRLYGANVLNQYLQYVVKHEQRATLSGEVTKTVDKNSIFYDENGKIKWENIRLYIPADIEMNMQKEYDMLNHNEIRLCCLLYFDVPIKIIPKVLPYKGTSIYSMLYRIKQKIGISDVKEMFRKIILNTV